MAKGKKKIIIFAIGKKRQIILGKEILKIRLD